MLSSSSIVSFFGVAVLIALAPGPDNIFVLAQSISNGRRAGVLVALGLATGLLFHTTAVTLGVATLFQSSPIAFKALKFVGASYLLFLAWKAFTTRTSGQDISASTPPVSARKLYGRGVIMNITNPKVTLFFLAFLPQFVDPRRGSVSLQMISLGSIFIVSTIIVFSLLALAAGSLGKRIARNPSAMKKIDRVAGVVFCGLALRLLFF
jgi:RhtB (resistance to homoserine/threonine) family protein